MNTIHLWAESEPPDSIVIMIETVRRHACDGGKKSKEPNASHTRNRPVRPNDRMPNNAGRLSEAIGRDLHTDNRN